MYPRHVRFSGSTGSKSLFYGAGYVNESKIKSAMDTHGNELLGKRKIGLMSDFEALDDPVDQTHGEFNLWEGAFVAHNSQSYNCVQCLSLKFVNSRHQLD